MSVTPQLRSSDAEKKMNARVSLSSTIVRAYSAATTGVDRNARSTAARRTWEPSCECCSAHATMSPRSHQTTRPARVLSSWRVPRSSRPNAGT